MSDDLVKRLRDTPNWMREGFQDWKDNVRTYDRAPFEAADRIEELEVKLSESEAFLAKAVSRLDKLAYWLDIDQDLWDALTAMEQSDHRRAQSEVQAIKDILTGGPRNGNE